MAGWVGRTGQGKERPEGGPGLGGGWRQQQNLLPNPTSPPWLERLKVLCMLNRGHRSKETQVRMAAF